MKTSSRKTDDFNILKAESFQRKKRHKKKQVRFLSLCSEGF